MCIFYQLPIFERVSFFSSDFIDWTRFLQDRQIFNFRTFCWNFLRFLILESNDWKMNSGIKKAWITSSAASPNLKFLAWVENARKIQEVSCAQKKWQGIINQKFNLACASPGFCNFTAFMVIFLLCNGVFLKIWSFYNLKIFTISFQNSKAS